MVAEGLARKVGDFLAPTVSSAVNLPGQLADALEYKNQGDGDQNTNRVITALRANVGLLALALGAETPQQVIESLAVRCRAAKKDPADAQTMLETQIRALLQMAKAPNPTSTDPREVPLSCPSLSKLSDLDVAKSVYNYLREMSIRINKPDEWRDNMLKGIEDILFQENAGGVPKNVPGAAELIISAVVEAAQKEVKPRLQEVVEAAQPAASRFVYRTAIIIAIVTLVLIALGVRYRKEIMAVLRRGRK